MVLVVVTFLTSEPVRGQTCGTSGQFCNGSAACDDGDPCNGAETCSPPDIIRFCRCDSTPPCDDGDPCTQDICTATPRGVLCDHQPGGCGDGLFCNGTELCNPFGGGCVDGPVPCEGPLLCDEANDRCVECLSASDCDDGVSCTFDSCDAASSACRHEWCLDTNFCNGREVCAGGGGCLAGSPPCRKTGSCDEANDRCADCATDVDCGDNDPCTVEVCDPAQLTCRITPCTLAFDDPPDQSVFPVGDLVEITGRGPRGLDVALVLDESGSISDEDFVRLREFAWAVVNGLPFASDGTAALASKVGISLFSSGSRRYLNLQGNRQSVLNMIMAMPQLGGFTCIGCGIDDGVDNLLTNGREGARKVMIVVTDGQNNLPPPDPDGHLSGAKEAAEFAGLTIFAIGVGSAVNDEILAIASEVPGVQTAYYVVSFSSLPNILNQLLVDVNGGGSAGMHYTVQLTLPDGTETSEVVDGSGQFRMADWAVRPGANVFTGRVETAQGDKTASLTLWGVYPCSSPCGNMNGSGGVDLRDVAAFLECFGGRPWDSPMCGCGDLNGDLLIDLADYAAFHGALMLPGKSFPPNCAAP